MKYLIIVFALVASACTDISEMTSGCDEATGTAIGVRLLNEQEHMCGLACSDENYSRTMQRFDEIQKWADALPDRCERIEYLYNLELYRDAAKRSRDASRSYDAFRARSVTIPTMPEAK